MENLPSVARMDDNSLGKHFGIKGLPLVAVAVRNEVDFDAHGEPDFDLVVEFGGCAAVETRKTVDEYPFH